MKLIKIEHDRCSELDHVTYLFAPSDANIDADLSWAQQQVMDAALANSQKPLKHLYSLEDARQKWPEVDSIKELEQKRKEHNVTVKEEERKRDSAAISFVSWLTSRGYKPLSDCEFEDNSYYVFWGHAHGLTWKYE